MKKILVVEDDRVIRENVAEILRLAQFNVVTAKNGREGSDVALEELPDLIVCDIIMPLLDGFGLLYVLSKNSNTASIPFIFLTAKTQKHDIRKGMELGADDYICKPFEDTELLSAIEARLRKYELLKSTSEEVSSEFNGLHSDNLESLSDLYQDKIASVYKKKEIIFHAGDFAQYVFILKRGRVKSYKTHTDGKEYITNLYTDGEFFGHPALFNETAYFDSAVVLESSEIIKIPKDDFLALTYKNNNIANKFIKMLSGDIENQEVQLVSLSYDSVRKRTAEALLFLKESHKNSNSGRDIFSIMVTREDLAGLAGTAIETVIRCLGEFKEDKLISVKGREITILDEQGLKDI